MEEEPIFVLTNGKIVGYGDQCVTEISVGIDSSLWALSCDKNEESSD